MAAIGPIIGINIEIKASTNNPPNKVNVSSIIEKLAIWFIILFILIGKSHNKSSNSNTHFGILSS